MNPKISVVIPTYNAEKYIETCIDSILQQTFEDFELIIVDDKSTDRSLEIIRNYRDPRIKIYQQIKNSGESSSWNLGLQISQGKYVYFMDHDDAILKNTLQIFFDAIEDTNFDVVYMNRFFLAQDLNFKFTDELRANIYSGHDDRPQIMSSDIYQRLQSEFVKCGVSVVPWIKIQRRDFLIDNEIYFPPTTRVGDVLFNLAELIFAKSACVVDACCYIYRYHESNTMNQVVEKSIRQAIFSMPPGIKYINELCSKANLPRTLQIDIETHFMNSIFAPFILTAYDKNVPIDHINEILADSLSNVPSQDIARILFNMLVKKTKENEVESTNINRDSNLQR